MIRVFRENAGELWSHLMITKEWLDEAKTYPSYKKIYSDAGYLLYNLADAMVEIEVHDLAVGNVFISKEFPIKALEILQTSNGFVYNKQRKLLFDKVRVIVSNCVSGREMLFISSYQKKFIGFLDDWAICSVILLTEEEQMIKDILE